MPQLRKEIACPEDRSCVVVLEPSGKEFVLPRGKSIEIQCQTEAGRDIEIVKQGNCYSVDLPEGQAVLTIDGEWFDENAPQLLSDIIELELAKLPTDVLIDELPDTFQSFVQKADFVLSELSPQSTWGKLGFLEIASQSAMELAKHFTKADEGGKFIASICRRLLARGGIVLNASSHDLAQVLWSAATTDRQLGTQPISVRRLLAGRCLVPNSMHEDVIQWSKRGSELVRRRSPVGRRKKSNRKK